MTLFVINEYHFSTPRIILFNILFNISSVLAVLGIYNTFEPLLFLNFEHHTLNLHTVTYILQYHPSTYILELTYFELTYMNLQRSLQRWKRRKRRKGGTCGWQEEKCTRDWDR